MLEIIENLKSKDEDDNGLPDIIPVITHFDFKASDQFMQLPKLSDCPPILDRPALKKTDLPNFFAFNAYDFHKKPDKEIPFDFEPLTEPLDDINKFTPEYIQNWARSRGHNFMREEIAI